MSNTLLFAVMSVFLPNGISFRPTASRVHGCTNVTGNIQTDRPRYGNMCRNRRNCFRRCRQKNDKTRKSTKCLMATQEQKMSEMIHVKVRLAQGSDTYVIRDVSADDEGRYFCRATNAFGVKEASVDVRMLGELAISAFLHPPTTSKLMLSKLSAACITLRLQRFKFLRRQSLFCQ